MTFFSQDKAVTVKRSSKEIIFQPFSQQRISRTLGVGAIKIRTPQSIDAGKSANAIPQQITVPVAAPPPPLEEVVNLLAIEASNARALVAEIALLAAALRPLMQTLPVPTDAPLPVKPKRKYTPRKTDQTVEAVPIKDRKWITFKQAEAIYPKSEQAFRHLAHQAFKYQKYPKAGLRSNGFEACVVRQPGSRNVYLNAEELERWMAQGQGDVQ